MKPTTVLILEVLAIIALVWAKGQKLPEALKVKGWVRKYPLKLLSSLQYKFLQEVGFLLLAPGAVIPEHNHMDNNEVYVRITPFRGVKVIDVCRKGGKHHLSNRTRKFKFLLVFYAKWDENNQ